MLSTKTFKLSQGGISPWIIIGMSLILFLAISIQAFMNYNREKEVMGEFLSAKGAALIKSFEAGARTGMMGNMGRGAGLQALLEETSTLPDILYIALVDNAGKVLAHNENSKIGTQFTTAEMMRSISPTGDAQWRVVESGKKPTAFEVYSRFLPLQNPAGLHGSSSMQNRNMMHGAQWGHKDDSDWCAPGGCLTTTDNNVLALDSAPTIFIGMDVAPVEAAMTEDLKITGLTSGIILLLGLAGVASLFWAQRYAKSKKLLQDTRAFASEMVASLPEGIIATQPDGVVTYINNIASNMLGINRDRAKGKTIADILPRQVQTILVSLLEGRNVQEREIEIARSDGGVLPLAIMATTILTDDKQSVGEMIVLRDLSQIKQLQREVQQQEKMAAIGNLAAGVAHEVRNPLSSIKGYATYFSGLFEEESSNKKAADIIISEVERLNRVISELLEVARPSDIQRRDTQLDSLLESTLDLVKQEAENSGVVISTVISDGLPLMSLDPDRFSQALINLYLNAIQAMKDDGGTMEILVATEHGHVSLTISDTGCGIPPSDVGNIFDPYYTSKSTGTGLGLSIVHKIIEAHGGKIDVDSTLGRGTTFKIQLPHISR
ncbi:ATP-binding protein [Pseudodesulfovibrio indicus]|jgi:two-component system sensor histidine kinase HydH|uniref:histidine kinase n=1 Tax=Pseudodesulfovibrio indicus TaxID=1716143 RepID=A0A126QNK3_9BACT|nr:ATP-binding protein [Pseudodesulfovibrio indicus]AMK11258.1 hypothetical protein AWY79_09085 [Pseudodesulfovibrio indicus]TDT92291.1 two-component system sensor histidine kinase HydH [Pseudodesulfovibrio indicus]